MSPRVCVTVLILFAAAISAGTFGCGRSASDGGRTATVERSDTDQSIQLKCGTTTYRVLRRRVSSDVHAACERAGASLDALQTYRASVSRFTCQEDDGHVVHSLLVPKDLRDAYEQNCHEYIRASDAYRSARRGSSDERDAALRTHHDAFAQFNDAANSLARKYAAEDNALFRQRQADQGSMNALVKDIGGAIEIAN
jgi:hypothetical protein